MAKSKEKTPLDKKNWVSSFNLVGEVKLNGNTFQLDQVSSKSDWQYSRMNLAVDCGTEYGTHYAQMMGGFSQSRDNIIYKFISHDGKNETTQIDWDDRFDEDIIKEVPDYQLITIGIEKDSKDKTFYKRFLSEYDAIAYVAEHLEDGAVVNIRGNIQYREYNGSTTMDRNITSIALSSATPDKYRASFTQTVLVGDDAIGKVDKEHMTVPIQCYVLEKMRSFNDYDLTEDGKIKGGQLVPLVKEFEYAFPQDQTKAKKAIDLLFKPKKNTVTQITMEGYMYNTGATTEMTIDDLPDDIKELVDLGILTEESALASVATNGPRVQRYVFSKPHIRNTTDSNGNTVSTLQIFREKYTADDLDLEFLHPKEEVDDGFMPAPEDEEVPFDDTKEDDASWLDDLGE